MQPCSSIVVSSFSGAKGETWTSLAPYVFSTGKDNNNMQGDGVPLIETVQRSPKGGGVEHYWSLRGSVVVGAWISSGAHPSLLLVGGMSLRYSALVPSGEDVWRMEEGGGA